MNRSEMKAIVKECLLEILRDGLGAGLPTPSQPIRQSQQPTFPIPMQSEAKRSVRMPTQHLRETIKREAGGNKVMESILADTASSTLPKMLQGESKGAVNQPRGTAERIVAATAPEDIFGSESASRWADLAFSGVKK